MDTTSEECLSDTQALEVKPKQVRVKRAPWRREGDKYNNKPLSETYFNDYYITHLKDIYIECPHCKTMIGKKNYARHISSGKKCLKNRALSQSI